jgi:1-acyl-sn-glycerol-3-phosphate acyltransferase
MVGAVSAAEVQRFPEPDESEGTGAPSAEPRPLKPSLATTLWSAWGWFTFGLACLIAFPLMVVTWAVTAPFDKGRYWVGYIFRKVCVFQQVLLPRWKFTVSGTMPANPRNPYIAVCNHESFADILLISHLPWEMKWLSKEGLFRIPVAGQMMSMAGDIKVVRGDKDSAKKAMAECAVWLDRDVSVMVFPEGTRVVKGELGPFKDGAFRLAVETGTPILPMVLWGTKDAMLKKDWRFGHAHAEVRVLEPVPVDGLTLDDVEDLKTRVRDLMVRELANR